MDNSYEVEWDVQKEISKGLKTLQREFTELTSAFVKLAEQVKVITGNMNILAIELAKIKKQLEENNGTIGNEKENAGDGEEKE